nr:uncharacterized protein LOC107439937 [Parasteatoda tepidariorum]
MSSFRNSNKLEDKYSKEKSDVVAEKHETDRSRSSSHVKGKSPHSRNRNSNRELYNHTGIVEERLNFSEDRHVAYRTDENNRERHKSDKDRYHASSFDQRDNPERNSGRSVEKVSYPYNLHDKRIFSKENRPSVKNNRSGEVFHDRQIDPKLAHSDRTVDFHNDRQIGTKLSHDDRTIEDIHYDRQFDSKFSHNDRYSERRNFAKSRSRSPTKIDSTHHKYPDSKSTQMTEHRHDSTSDINKSSTKSFDFHNSNEGKHFSDKPTYYNKSLEFRQKGYHYTERHDGYKNNRNNSSFKESYNTNDERHISFKNPSVSGDDEFVASLLQKIDFLSNQVDHLTQENENLKLSLKEESAAEISIKFGNKRFEEKYLPILKDIATDLITGRCSVKALSSFLKTTDATELQSENWNLEGEIFSLDNSCEVPKESSSVPRYDQSFNEVLQNSEFSQESETDVKSKECKASTKVCFNCEGDHLINECPLPWDRRKIAIARRKKQSTFVSNKRYHVYENQHSKFKPGVISEELRNALDLGRDQIPLYIYRMRILDYPPGWRAEAAIESSGIALYDSEGIAQPDEKCKKEKNSESAVQYDHDKLIDYPGFNIPLTPDLTDEFDVLGFPPFQESQLRTYVEETLPKAIVRKYIHIPDYCDSNFFPDPSVIELKEFQPPLPEDKAPPPPPEFSPTEIVIASPEYSPFSPSSSPSSLCSPNSPKNKPDPPEAESDSEDCVILVEQDSGGDSPIPNPDSNRFGAIMEPFTLNEDSSGGDTSPSLVELEEIKKRLVMALGIDAEPSSPVAVANEDSVQSLKTVDSDTVENTNEFSNLSDSSFSSKASTSGKSVSNSGILPRTDSIGSKLVSLGTPSISRHSSFTRLPNYENFSKNVTSHMDFENLPSSVGTYQRMKKVIKKVKNKLNSLMH